MLGVLFGWNRAWLLGVCNVVWDGEEDVGSGWLGMLSRMVRRMEVG